jgi:hypothetical protein
MRSARAPGIKAERSCSELRNQQGTAEHGHVFHEENHLYLGHHGVTAAAWEKLLVAAP